MPRLFCKFAFFLAIAAALSATSAKRGEAYYSCITDTTRSAQGSGSSLTSSTFLDLAGATVAISTTGTCVRVEFSAQIGAKYPKGLRVRAVVFGTTAVGFPPAAEFYTSENRLDGRMVSFTIPNFPIGNRTVKIQVLSLDGTEITIGRWTMSVHHIGSYG